MNTRGLLDQLLKSGQELLQNKTGAAKPGAGADKGALGGLLSGSGGLGSLLSGAGGGALAAGAMGLLLGNKSDLDHAREISVNDGQELSF